MDHRDRLLPLHEGIGGDHGARGAVAVAREVRVEHAYLVVRRWVAELEHHHEAIDLRGRQRERAVVILRVHRRQHLERIRHAMGGAIDRDRALLHHLEERGLRLRGGAVDLVGEEEVGEDGAATEDELAGARVVDGGAGDIHRHEIGRELDATEARAQRARERLAEERLAHARRVHQEHVTARRHGGQHARHDVVLADHDAVDRSDHLEHLGPHARDAGAQVIDDRGRAPSLEITTAIGLLLVHGSLLGDADPLMLR